MGDLGCGSSGIVTWWVWERRLVGLFCWGWCSGYRESLTGIGDGVGGVVMSAVWLCGEGGVVVCCMYWIWGWSVVLRSK